jgi:TRAP-type mannitol/chloroaromatic compound transport system substrate-binding protein
MVNRRNAIAVGVAAAASALQGRPAVAANVRVLNLVSDYPAQSSSYQATKRFADLVSTLSSGRIKIVPHAAGELVRAFESFAAVSAGLADLYVSAEYYHANVTGPAANFFTAVPFGLTAREFAAWIDFGGGQQLWDEFAAQSDIKPLYIGNAGIQMGGWFKTPIESLSEFKGLRYRIVGLAATVLERVGVVTVALAGSDVLPALRSGALDAVEWVGPAADLSMGFQTIAKNYYYPGWHEPGGATSLGINLRVWESLTTEEQLLFQVAARESNANLLARYDHDNPVVLDQLLREDGVVMRQFSDDILRALAQESMALIADIASHDSLSAKIHSSFMEFRRKTMLWSSVADGPFTVARQRFSAG